MFRLVYIIAIGYNVAIDTHTLLRFPNEYVYMNVVWSIMTLHFEICIQHTNLGSISNGYVRNWNPYKTFHNDTQGNSFLMDFEEMKMFIFLLKWTNRNFDRHDTLAIAVFIF